MSDQDDRPKKPRIDPNNPRIVAALGALGAAPGEDPLFYDWRERDADGAAKPRQPEEPAPEQAPQAAVYVPPTTIPPEVTHKTLDMRRVRIADEVNPRKAPTTRSLQKPPAHEPAAAAAVETHAEAPSAGPEGVPAPAIPPEAVVPPAFEQAASLTSEVGIFPSPLATTPPKGAAVVPASSPWGASAAPGGLDPAALPSSHAPVPQAVGAAPGSPGTRRVPARWVVLAAIAILGPIGTWLLFQAATASTAPTSSPIATGSPSARVAPANASGAVDGEAPVGSAAATPPEPRTSATPDPPPQATGASSGAVPRTTAKPSGSTPGGLSSKSTQPF